MTAYMIQILLEIQMFRNAIRMEAGKRNNVNQMDIAIASITMVLWFLDPGIKVM